MNERSCGRIMEREAPWMEPERNMASVARKVRLQGQPSDFAYWQTQSYEERLAALEEIRQEYHRWRSGAELPISSEYLIDRFNTAEVAE
jgi:hypothetical protein